MKNIKCFLGGTCNGSNWRDGMMRLLDKEGISYFNPVVEDWTPECQDREIEERENCDICLYTITPKMTGVYSIAEVVDDSNKRPDKTVLILLEQDEEVIFTEHQWKSLVMVSKMVYENGGKTFNSLLDAANWIGTENER